MTDPRVPDPAGDLRRLLAAGRFRDLLAAYAALEPVSARARPAVSLVAATAATRVGDLAQAQELAQAAASGFVVHGDVDGAARAANLLGVIAIEQGELHAAQVRLEEALELARRLGDAQLEARAANNLASARHLQGDAPAALALFRDALLSYQRLGDRRGAAETHHNLGIAHRMLGAWREAEAAADQAVRHAELAGDAEMLALALMGRVELEVERGDLPLADGRLARAAALAREAGDRIGVAEAERIAARIALRGGDPERAFRLAGDAFAQGEALGAALLAAESAVVAALAGRALGREADASAWRVQALDRLGRLGATGHTARFEQEWRTPA